MSYYELGGDRRDGSDLRERFFAGATAAACVFSFISCVSLVVVMPMLSEAVLVMSERMAAAAKHCNESMEEIRQRLDLIDTLQQLNESIAPPERQLRRAPIRAPLFGRHSADTHNPLHECRPGPPGRAGSAGRAGQAGQHGAAGTPGRPGRWQGGGCGAAASACAICPPGAPGHKGTTGERGEPGPRGDRGLDGNVGTVGRCGNPGPPGVRGVRGAPGDAGDAGVTPVSRPPIPGPPGLAGPPGPRGLAGAPGASGPDGADGEQIPGVKGLPGPPGRDGRPGLPGPMGMPGRVGSNGHGGICPNFCAADGGVFYNVSAAEFWHPVRDEESEEQPFNSTTKWMGHYRRRRVLLPKPNQTIGQLKDEN